MRAADFIGGLVRALARERARVALTVLGIAVGTFAVATLVSLGESIRHVILDSLHGLGENLVIVAAEPPRAGLAGGHAGHSGHSGRSGRSGHSGALSSQLAESDLETVRALDSVQEAAAIVAAPCTAALGATSATTTCVGVGPDYLDVARIVVDVGAEFNGSMAPVPRAEAILGATVARRLFEGGGGRGLPDAPPGAEAIAGGTGSSMDGDPSAAATPSGLPDVPLQLDGRRVRVIGVARARGHGVGGADEDDFVLVPKAFARQQLMARASPEDVDALFVLARPDPGPAAAMADIEDELARKRHVESVRGAISVTSLAGLMATSLQASELLTLLLAGMAGISVLVAGVGIVNVMLTNVAERRLEIGLKLAIGASPGVIAAEFLAEAMVLAALGALLGLAGAQLLAWLLTATRSVEVTLTPGAAGLSLALALVVGVFAGAWPADRAAQLQPREILRDV